MLGQVTTQTVAETCVVLHLRDIAHPVHTCALCVAEGKVRLAEATAERIGADDVVPTDDLRAQVSPQE
jgi:hypothetical protein